MFFYDLKKKVNLQILSRQNFLQNKLKKVRTILSDKSGEGTVNVAMTILISLVLGGLLLGGLYTLIKSNLLPAMMQKLNDIIGHGK